MAEDGRLVLVDFGSAQIEEGNITRSITVMFKRGFTPDNISCLVFIKKIPDQDYTLKHMEL